MARLLNELSGKNHWRDTPAHIDPDLRRDSLVRGRGWRPTLGQTGTAQSHLRNQGVTVGDIFVFFGLFKPVEQGEHGWRFSRLPARHVIWGWLQVGKIHPVEQLSATALPWCRYHPHFQLPADPLNTLYQASRRLTLNESETGLPGSGVFRHYRRELSLTAPDASTPSQWQLPLAFYPGADKPPLSYHSKSERWQHLGDKVRLQAAARGQEFVLDANYYPDIHAWLHELLQAHS